MNHKQDNTALILARKNCNFTQERVAKTAGISTRHYRNIEANKCEPGVETAISIANLLGCEVIDLFGPRRQPEKSNTLLNFNTDKAVAKTREKLSTATAEASETEPARATGGAEVA
jgi:DNA-binding XRE family transcriptional regulator